MPTSCLEAALALARQGVPVFPCVPGGKAPATARGFHDATTDETTIRRWFEQEPALNIAYCPHLRGECVIDIDPGGEDEWALLELEHGLSPPTKTVRTPRGGQHVYFAGELPPTQHKLGLHIDTRGVGSYVLVPPSVVGGRAYEDMEVGLEAAPVPAWIGAKLAEFAKSQVARSVDDLDLPTNVSRGKALLASYVAAGHVAIEGEGGDHRTYAVAAELLNLGLSEEKVLELLGEWNEHCEPPWDHDELAVKVANAARYAQNEPGAWGTEPPSQVFGATLEDMGLLGNPSLMYPAHTLAEMRARPAPEWLLPEVIQKKKLGMLFAPPGHGKTWVAVYLAAQAGLAGHRIGWIAGEGEDDLAPRFGVYEMLNGNIDLPVHVFDEVPQAGQADQITRFVDDVKAQELQFDLLVLDTAITAMLGLDENNAKDATQFIEAMKFLRKHLSCAVLFIHHTGKDASKGARGSIALSGGVDSSLEVELHEPSMTFALHVRRQRSAPIRKEPWYFESKKLGGSLILSEISGKAYRQLTAPKSAVAAGPVHNALSKFVEPVTTRVLASTLTPALEDETPEDHEARVTVVEKRLRLAARNVLECYATGKGQGMLWAIPAVSGDA